MDDIFLPAGSAGDGTCDQMGFTQARITAPYYLDCLRENWRENIIVPRSQAQGAPLGGLAAAGLARSSGETIALGERPRDVPVGYTPEEQSGIWMTGRTSCPLPKAGAPRP